MRAESAEEKETRVRATIALIEKEIEPLFAKSRPFLRRDQGSHVFGGVHGAVCAAVGGVGGGRGDGAQGIIGGDGEVAEFWDVDEGCVGARECDEDF